MKLNQQLTQLAQKADLVLPLEEVKFVLSFSLTYHNKTMKALIIDRLIKTVPAFSCFEGTMEGICHYIIQKLSL